MYTAQLKKLDAPIAIRYPRGQGVLLNWKVPFEEIKIGKAEELKKGTSLAVLSIGTIANNVTEAIENLKVSHYNMRFVKPLDKSLLNDIFKNHEIIVTVEDGCIHGGFGSAVCEFATENEYKNKIKNVGIPDKFIEHGSVQELQNKIGLSVEKIRDFLTDILTTHQ